MAVYVPSPSDRTLEALTSVLNNFTTLKTQKTMADRQFDLEREKINAQKEMTKLGIDAQMQANIMNYMGHIESVKAQREGIQAQREVGLADIGMRRAVGEAGARIEAAKVGVLRDQVRNETALMNENILNLQQERGFRQEERNQLMEGRKKILSIFEDLDTLSSRIDQADERIRSSSAGASEYVTAEELEPMSINALVAKLDKLKSGEILWGDEPSDIIMTKSARLNLGSRQRAIEVVESMIEKKRISQKLERLRGRAAEREVFYTGTNDVFGGMTERVSAYIQELEAKNAELTKKIEED